MPLELGHHVIRYLAAHYPRRKAKAMGVAEYVTTGHEQ
jgi:hypothetical protein